MKQRFDQGRIGQLIISGFLVVFFAVGLVQNLPKHSAIRDLIHPLTDPVGQATGLSTGWGMFANPINVTKEYDFKLIMADGEVRHWQVVPGTRGWDFGITSAKPWRKFAERTEKQKGLRQNYVRWVVRRLTGPGEHPARVEFRVKTTTTQRPDPWAKPPTVKTRKLWTQDLEGRR